MSLIYEKTATGEVASAGGYLRGIVGKALEGEALEDKTPMPARVWNRIPDDIRNQVVELVLQASGCD